MAYRWPAVYALGFFILFACYFSAAFPLGDDAKHLFAFSDHALPQRGGWIANRVVDAFFNRYLFLLFRPIDFLLSGSSFFQSFARYTALLNATIGIGLVILASHMAIDQAKINDFLKGSVLGCCLSLTLKAMYGDTTMAIAYNLTTLVTLAFASSLLPISSLFEVDASRGDDLPKNKYYFLILGSYFTAFGLEIFMLFAWAYVLAYFVSSSLLEISRAPFRALKAVFRCFEKPTRLRTILILYAGFSASSLLFLLRWSGRTREHANKVHYDMSGVSRYVISFLQGLATNRASLFLILALLVVLAYSCFRHVQYNKRSRLRDIRGSEMASPIDLYRPLTFIVILNAAYLAILFMAGFEDNSVMVASSSRDLLFLSPLLFVNLAMALRCLILLSLETEIALTPIVLGSLLLVLSFSYQFLSSIREKSLLSANVSKAFELAASSGSDVVEVPICFAPGESGYPILPTEADKRIAWYRNSYRDLFRTYYNRTFTVDGPKFTTSSSILKDCSSKP